MKGKDRKLRLVYAEMVKRSDGWLKGAGRWRHKAGRRCHEGSVRTL